MRPRRSDPALSAFAPAKVNLFLEILGRRSDGYHDLITLMSPLRWGDWLQWSPPPRSSRSFTFSVLGDGRSGAEAADVPSGEENLVVQAARALGEAAGCEPQGRLTLHKNTPPQSGLGGGSSDAAAALTLLNKAWGIDYPRARLAAIGGRLGCDIPFFFARGSAVCSGRGEVVRPTPMLPPLNLVVARPRQGVSTPEAFARFSAGRQQDCGAEEAAGRTQEIVALLRHGKLTRAASRFTNRLERAAKELTEAVTETLDQLRWAGCLAQWMTGSGSACVGLAATPRQARAIGARLAGTRLGTVVVTTTR